MAAISSFDAKKASGLGLTSEARSGSGSAAPATASLPNHIQVAQAAVSRQAELQADVARIESILDGWHYSDADEQEVTDIISRWAYAGTASGRNTYLDLLFAQLATKTTTVGPLGEVTSYYNLIFTHFDHLQEIRRLRDAYSTNFVSQGGTGEAFLADQNAAQVAGEFWGDLKTGAYDWMIEELRAAQKVALDPLRARVAELPPGSFQRMDAELLLTQVELATDSLIAVLLGIVGVAAGFASGIANMVWGFIQIIYGLCYAVALFVAGFFNERYHEELQRSSNDLIKSLKNVPEAIVQVVKRWRARWDVSDNDRRALMVGELIGEIAALFVGLGGAAKLGGGLPKLQLSLRALPRFATAVGPAVAGPGGAVALNVAGPPIVAAVGAAAATSVGERSGGSARPAETAGAEPEAPRQRLEEPPVTEAGERPPAFDETPVPPEQRRRYWLDSKENPVFPLAAEIASKKPLGKAPRAPVASALKPPAIPKKPLGKGARPPVASAPKPPAIPKKPLGKGPRPPVASTPKPPAIPPQKTLGKGPRSPIAPTTTTQKKFAPMTEAERAATNKALANTPVQGPEIWESISKEVNIGTPAKGSPAEDALTAGLAAPKGAPGTVDVLLQEHRHASEIRHDYGVSGTDVQSAHIGATSFLRDVSGYSRSEAETVLLPRAIHNQGFDQYWKDWAIAQREAGRTQVSVAEMYRVMLDAINQIPVLQQRTKNAMAWRLELELFRDLGLKATDQVPLPYSNIKKK